SGKKPSVAHLRTFGCLAYVGSPKVLRSKLDMRAKMGIMVGYAIKTRGYRIWLTDEKKLVESVSVKFNEKLRGVEAVLDPKQRATAYFRIEDINSFDYSDEETKNPTVETVESPVVEKI
ncbi:retroelement pol polyprotein, partial [Lasius niger]